MGCDWYSQEPSWGHQSRLFQREKPRCSATHPTRTKPKIRILGIVVRVGCVALHYSVHFFTIFLFHATIVIEGRVSVQDLYGSHTIFVSAGPARENEGLKLRAMCMYAAGSPFQPYKTQKRCGNRTDLAVIPSPSITIVAWKRKIVKSGRSSVVLRTLPVLQR